MIAKVHAEKERVVPNCATCASPCGNTSDYDMKEIWEADEDIRSLKSLILFGIRGMAAYAYHAAVLGYEDETVNAFFYKALSFLGFDLEMGDLLPRSGSRRGEFKVYGALDRANTETFGNPEPTRCRLPWRKDHLSSSPATISTI